jgi:rare lipoprotein A
MRQTQLGLGDIFSTKVRVTIYGALFCCAGLIVTPQVFAQISNVDNEPAVEASDDAVRDALKSVFKETAPERIKEKVKLPVAKSKEETLAKPAASKSIAAKHQGSPASSNHKVAFSGVADYYADRFHGKRTASGQLHDKMKMTAAHLSLPFGTKVKVVSRHTGKSCVVTVNDRGPYTKNRIIDLSFAAAKELGLVTAGSRLVDCYLIEPE